jgi:hypothetical protein
VLTSPVNVLSSHCYREGMAASIMVAPAPACSSPSNLNIVCSDARGFCTWCCYSSSITGRFRSVTPTWVMRAITPVRFTAGEERIPSPGSVRALQNLATPWDSHPRFIQWGHGRI